MKTLIAYATKHGATAKCASILSKKLEGEVDLHDLKTGPVPDLAQYERVIIGGSIYAGTIRKEVSAFCSQNISILKNKRLGLFICCMFPNNAETQMKISFPQELLNTAAAKDSFGGEMRFGDMNFGERLLTKMVSRMAAKNDASIPAIDMKKDASMILTENIDKFAQLMNYA